jgi:hypothetical protein
MKLSLVRPFKLCYNNSIILMIPQYVMDGDPVGSVCTQADSLGDPDAVRRDFHDLFSDEHCPRRALQHGTRQ